MTLPNFLIIGAMKSGTTSVHRYLGQHPEIFVSPVKETNFFVYDANAADPEEGPPFAARTLEDYRAVFSGVRDEKAVGETSPHYMHLPRASGAICEVLDDVRLIAILREPADRAYSNYMMHRRSGRERRDFERAIDDELAGNNRHVPFTLRQYVEAGFYHRHLMRYFDAFGGARIAVFLYDDLRGRPRDLLREIFTFLDVDPGFEPDMRIRHNVSGEPRSRSFDKLIGKTRLSRAVRRCLPPVLEQRALAAVLALQRRNLDRPRCPVHLHARLLDLYRRDTQDLQELIGRDLSHWLRQDVAAESVDP